MGFVQRKLVKLVIRVVTYPKLTLAICSAALLGSILLALFGLQLSTDEDQLLTPKLRFFREYKEYSRQFPENDAFVVLLEPLTYAKPPAAQRWSDFADCISDRLLAMKDVVKRVDSHVSPNEMGVQGMAFDEWENVRETSPHAGEMAQMARIVGDPEAIESRVLGGPFALISGDSNMTLRTLEAMRRGGVESSGPMTGEIMRSLASAVSSPRDSAQWSYGQEYFRMWKADPRAVTDPRSNGYNMIPDETKRGTPAYKTEPMLVIAVHTIRNFSSLSEVSKPLDRMRAEVAEVARDFPDFKKPIITGRAALEADQMRTSDHDTRIAEIMGLSLVFVVLFLFLRNLWLVIAAELCLGTGIGWTFGWATLMVGRLNLLSLVFVIALIGIGMDYLIQILVRYRFEKKRYGRPQAIWARVFRFVSPPISTACCGAAGAFFASLLTNFRGASELGLIAGGGLLLCLLAGYTMLPALLTVFPAKVGRVADDRRYRHREEQPKAGGWRLLPAATWVVIVAAGLSISLPPKFDPNLIGLQDDSLESVQAVRKLGTWSAVVLSSDLEKLRSAREALRPHNEEERQTTTIDRTDSLLDAYDKGAWLAQQNTEKIKVNWKQPNPPTAGQLREIADAAERIAREWSMSAGAASTTVKDVQSAAATLAAALRDEKIPVAQRIARVSEWQQRFVRDVRVNTEQFAPPPLHIENLPPSLREHLISKGIPVFLGRATDNQGVYALIGFPDEPSHATKVREGDLIVWDESKVKKIIPAGEKAVIDGKEITGDALVLANGARDQTIVVPLGRDLHGNEPAPIYVLYIYPKEDLWDARNLDKFVTEVESRMATHQASTGLKLTTTGIALQLKHSTAEIQVAFLKATCYALILIFILVYLDLRKIGQTLLAVSVLAIGLPMLLLLMHAWHEWLGDPFGIPGSWNFANFFALPILIGAGHEYGVFLVHRYRETLHDPRRVWRPWDPADRALLLCGIVTTCSFGFLVIARHHGLQSLGWVMAVGTACIYLAGVIVLRPVLTWRLKRKGVYDLHREESAEPTPALREGAGQ